MNGTTHTNQRANVIEVYKIFNGLDDSNINDFCEVDTGNRRGHSIK